MSHFATYAVELQLGLPQTGVFRLDLSAVGGSDVLGEIGGGGGDYTDISALVQTLRIRRGRGDDLTDLAAGECAVGLKDLDGHFNPENAAGPYYGQLRPLRRLRVGATHDGTAYPLFLGFIRTIEANPARDARHAALYAVDLYLWLERARPTIASAGATTTGAAIGRVLDAVGWTGAAWRNLDTGDAIPDFSADGGATALALIGDLLAAEGGQFAIAADGVATYRDRSARNRAPRTSAQSTVAGAMRGILPGVDLDAIRNRATVTRTGGVPQTATDYASVDEYGYADYAPLDTPYLASDARALALAQWRVNRGKDADGRVRRLDLANRDAATLAAILARDLGDRVAVSESLGGTDAEYHIEQIEHAVGLAGRHHRATWTLTRRRGGEAFIIGTSAVGGTDVLTF